MFIVSNTNWNCTYYYFEFFVSFQTLQLIQLFVTRNLSKSEACSQQQPILLSILVATIKLFMGVFLPLVCATHTYTTLHIFHKIITQNMCNIYTHTTLQVFHQYKTNHFRSQSKTRLFFADSYLPSQIGHFLCSKYQFICQTMNWTLDGILEYIFNHTHHEGELSVIFDFDYSIYRTIPIILKFQKIHLKNL